jgi:hypothetical protein
MKKQNYEVIEMNQVFDIICKCSIDFMSPINIVNVISIANLLKTSRYQVKKQISKLKSFGFIELECVFIPDEYEIFPPYWGYGVTEAGTTTDTYKKAVEIQDKFMLELAEDLKK